MSKGKKGRIYPYCTPTMTSSCVQTSRVKARERMEQGMVATARLRQLQQGSVNAAQCVGRVPGEPCLDRLRARESQLYPKWNIAPTTVRRAPKQGQLGPNSNLCAQMRTVCRSNRPASFLCNTRLDEAESFCEQQHNIHPLLPSNFYHTSSTIG